MKFFTLPNLLTLANLFSGCLVCVFLIMGFSPDILVYFLIASLIFDLLDGFVARITHSNSNLGIQLDSLADMITFGLFPGLLMMELLGFNLYIEEIKNVELLFLLNKLSFLGLFITLFSALRLAKFNLDIEQSYYFKGLPTPANTIFIFSIYWLIYYNKANFLNNTYLLIVITALSCILLISNIPLFALKFKGFKWKGNTFKIVFLLCTLLLILLLKMIAVPLVIIGYILISLILKKKIVNNKL